MIYNKLTARAWLTRSRLGDVVNKWRGRIDLEHVAMFDGPMLAEALKIPFTYCWSPALVPKPNDWGPHIGQFVLGVPETTSLSGIAFDYRSC